MGKLLRCIHYLLHRDRMDQELAEEMAAHREMMAADRRGAFGNALHLREQSRDVWGWLWIEHFLQDLRYAARGFRRDRRFTLSAFGAIFLAVGAATAVFSVVDRSLFRPLPYAHGDRLVTVGLMMPAAFGPGEYMFLGAYRDWKVEQHALELTSWTGVGACDLEGEAPRRLDCARVDASFLPMLGIEPRLGRVFTAAEDQPGAEPVALISYAMWRAQFGADPSAVGKTINLDGAPTRIIGVLPANFETPDLISADLVIPSRMPLLKARNYPLKVIGRLAAGQTMASAMAALAGPLQNFRLEFAVRNQMESAKVMRVNLEGLRDRQNRQYRVALWVMLGAVGAFVLIACANVANLLLARSAGRRQEFAIRAALGGSRARLATQLLTESALLGLTGGAAGCGLAWALLRVFVAIAPDGALRMRAAAIDARVLAFALALSLATALVFGLAPSLQRLRGECLGGARAVGRRHTWVRQALISAQLAISLMLLAGAGLLLISLWRLQNAPLGFDREHVVTASFTLPVSRYSADARQIGFFNQLDAKLSDLPVAVAAAITDSMPPGPAIRSAPYWRVVNNEEAHTDPGMQGSVRWRYVSPGYFRAMGIPIRRGRGFTEADRAPGVRDVVVNEKLAGWMAGGADPVGMRLGRNIVIGVAENVRNAGVDRDPEAEFYQVRKTTREGIAGSEDFAWFRRATVIVRSRLSQRDAKAQLRAAIRDVDPAVPIQMQTMADRVDNFFARPRFQTSLLLLFALTGLTLAGIGLYGLISFLVAERTREIGVRVALGATPEMVEKLVVADGARWTAIGAVVGIASSAGLLKLLEGLLYQTKTGDLRVFAGAVAVLFCVAMLAAWLPARRAARIDPMAALRQE